MNKKRQPQFDPELLDELARCYARAAVDRMIDDEEADAALRETEKQLDAEAKVTRKP